MEWLAGLQARKQQPLLGMPGLVPVHVDLCQMIMNDRRDLGWEVEGVPAEAQAGLTVGDGHGVAGETDDPGERLPEHQDQQPDQSRGDLQIVVVEEPVEMVESFTSLTIGPPSCLSRG